MPPSLSVIVPAYNRPELLRECVASLLAHAPRPVEVIVADDGSREDLRPALASFPTDTVRLIRRENGGPAAARNTGYNASRGDLVAFLDNDDEWLPGGPSDLCQLLSQHAEIDAAFGDALEGTPEDGYCPVTERYGGSAFAAIPATPLEGSGAVALERSALLHCLARRNVVFLGALVVRRTLVERLGTFDESLFGGEDYEFVLRMASEGRFAFLKHPPVARYRKQPGSISANSERMQEQFVLALRRTLDRCRLTDADRLEVATRHREKLFEFAYLAFDRGDTGAARARFRRLLAETSWSPTALAYWLASYLPSPAVRRLRDAKRGLGHEPSGDRPC
jgi:glycosyltransferase involved in cell wall biosynthesis